MLAFLQNDFATAEADFQRALELNLSAYGENSNETATSLSGLARIYFTQKDFAKTEAVMTRSLKIFETMYGQDNFQLTLPVAGLCQAYDASGQTEKAAACHARMVSLVEKQYGPDTPYLVRDLTAEPRLSANLAAMTKPPSSNSAPRPFRPPKPIQIEHLGSFVLNIVLYKAVFFLHFGISKIVRRRWSRNPSL
jgi:tetratricopeptide (TPR) repeat protein